jgi:hypothetical protein
MPAPQAAVFGELVKAQFRSFAIRVPNGPPLPRAFLEALSEAQRSVAPLPMPPALFVPDSGYELHVATQKHLTQVLSGFIDRLSTAVCSAWGEWQSAAVLSGVVIAGTVASGGQVSGPPLDTLILANAPRATEMETKYSKTVAKVLGQGWQAYTTSLVVAGMPWYPSFAAVRAPVAPPTPNAPCPVTALAQVTTTLAKPYLTARMATELGDEKAPYHVELFDSIADAFEKCFAVWQSTTMVTNVIATGLVPSFAPPATPAGPVVGGTGNMTPGGFV